MDHSQSGKTRWQQGELVLWRGIFRERVWQAQTVIVVKDTPEEIAVALLPGTECMIEDNYAKGKDHGGHRWDFKEKPWILTMRPWRTNRLLLLLEPGKYYSTILFWNDESNQFTCYYINFQLPYQRMKKGIDTLDLDLDLVIHPDFNYHWKDEVEYQTAIEHEVILPEWVQSVEAAKSEILAKLEARAYPFDGSWLDWKPDPSWSPPTLPENWDKI